MEEMDENELEQHLANIVNNDDFFFESDHLALKGNPDYTAVLQTITILQTQKIQATKDVDKLSSMEKFALDYPEMFIQKLTKGELKDLPSHIKIMELPKINFENYGVYVPDFIDQKPNSDPFDITVRGRVFDQTKPETFNQLWTYEEQRRLEELLVEYPPEPIEMRRFAKIARALGNRTTKQVASRLQKFFKKLHSAGMPVPGRIPKSNRFYLSKSNRITKQALRPTTFFPANHVPVTITDDDDLTGVAIDPNMYRNGSTRNSNDIDNFGETSTFIVDEESENEESFKESIEAKTLKLIMRVKKDKERENQYIGQISEHDGFTCDYCYEEPIIGTRWHCNVCTEYSLDFCSECIITQLQSDNPHSLTHKIVGLRVGSDSLYPTVQSDVDSDDTYDSNKFNSTDQNQKNNYDDDYMLNVFSKNQYNYLDPNFLPE